MKDNKMQIKKSLKYHKNIQMKNLISYMYCSEYSSMRKNKNYNNEQYQGVGAAMAVA